MAGPRTLESWMMIKGKSGDHFYSDKVDRHLTAIASHSNRNILTERLIAIKPGVDLKSKYITKVTLL